MKHLKRNLVFAVLVVGLMAGSIVSGVWEIPVDAVGLGGILKVGGNTMLVTTYGHACNAFIQRKLGLHPPREMSSTKIVPIFSMARGTYVGTAQVVGTRAKVRLVQRVAAVETTIGVNQGNSMIPISTKRPGKILHRVTGVGIAAIIDYEG